MTPPTNIDEVILALQAERPVLTKDRKGQVGNQKTRYADLVQVNEVVLGRLNKMDTIWVCRPHLDGGAFGLHYELLHVPSGTAKTGVWPLRLSENPQQLGSATTYGRRYALLAVTGIVADDEDDDGGTATGTRYAQRAPARGPAGATAQRAQRATGSRPPLPTETSTQQRRMHALFTALGLADRDERLRYAAEAIGRPIESSNDLTTGERQQVIDALTRWQAQESPEPGETQ